MIYAILLAPIAAVVIWRWARRGSDMGEIARKASERGARVLRIQRASSLLQELEGGDAAVLYRVLLDENGVHRSETWRSDRSGVFPDV